MARPTSRLGFGLRLKSDNEVESDNEIEIDYEVESDNEIEIELEIACEADLERGPRPLARGVGSESDDDPGCCDRRMPGRTSEFRKFEGG